VADPYSIIHHSFLVQYSGIFGIYFGIGLKFLWLIRIVFFIIFFSLLIRHVDRQREDQLCNSFGFDLFGLCKMNVIIDFLATRKTLLISCWIK